MIKILTRALPSRSLVTSCVQWKGAPPAKGADQKDGDCKDKDKKKPEAPPEKPKINPVRTFKVYRYSGDPSQKPRLQSYQVDVSTIGPMVLDAMIKIKDMDPTFAFRRSCREGICGSCGINLQGHNCLACVTPIPRAATVTIHPLPHMYVQKDLVVDYSHFFAGYNSIRPYLVRQQPPPHGQGQYAQSIKDNKKMVGLYECVLCACCSTACPSYWWNGRRFLGPATLLHAYRWVIDSRDEDTTRRLQQLRDDFKAFRCHTILNCSVACPKGLSPGTHIAHLKRLIAGLDKKPNPDMEPMSLMKDKKTC